ncbi:threonine--tRNA ligase [Patescibacteria group bacterium]|nr:threonine--tRNA ligase [Patescibacteria group bacterium]MBU1876883.1 threonine--tRNA ligase [Patescibacteria group bacterium]
MKTKKKKIDKIGNIRHSLSHLMATVVQEFFPGVKLGMGPAIENGFYYDFDLVPKGTSFTPQDLSKIEKRMRELIKQNIPFNKRIITRTEAKELFKNQPYKLDLIKELRDNKINLYQHGNFVDLCLGPHVKKTEEIPQDAFKLTKIAGAYWKGDEKNPMLSRIYGLAFETKKELEDYLKIQEEAEKRDHRKLGKDLDLFYFSELVGPGLPLFTPKGTFIKEELQKNVEAICREYGFEKVSTPHLTKIDLYEISGHAKKFSDELFRVTSPRGHEFVLRPVQCPHQTQIYASKIRSYKELPIRYMESSNQYRAEKTGEVGGLNRVYAITVEDGHTFCTPEQVKSEIKAMVNIIKKFYTSFDLWGKHKVFLSVRDYKHHEKYIGEKKDWDLCEKILQEVSDEMKLNAEKKEGEAALYGPKLDFMFKDALGREIQIPTVQIDFATPKRFNLTYINKEGKEQNPVMVHRAILGSYERFLALIIEYFAGALPLWLSPVQVQVIPIGERHKKYAQSMVKELEAENIRASARIDNETVGKKIREGEMQKIPYLLIVGDREMKNETIGIRERGKGDLGAIGLSDFIEQIKIEIKDKKIKK